MNGSLDFLKILSLLNEGCSCCNCRHSIATRGLADYKIVCLEKDSELSLSGICGHWSWKENFVILNDPALLEYFKGDKNESKDRVGRDQSRL